MLGLSPEETRAQKLDMLRLTLVRELGGDFDAFPITWREIPLTMGYRHRLRLQIHPGGQVGFFNPNKAAHCAVLAPKLRDGLRTLLAFLEPRRPYLDQLSHLELRAPDLDGRYAVCFYPRPQELGPFTELEQRMAELGEDWLVAVAHPDAEIPSQRHALLELYHYVPITSFLQVNRAVNDQLVGDVLAQAQSRGLRTFCDLYAGAGNFALPLLAHGLSGVAVEYDAKAVAACASSAEAQGLTTGRTIAGDSGAIASQLASAGERFDLVIVDPPRAGLRDKTQTVAQVSRSHLLYCSCNPVSLARDLRQFLELGAVVEAIAAYDLFFGTRHLEACVWLRMK